jgi:hypothetical protein
MITLNRSLRLLDSGLSLATLGSDKKSNYTWSKNQTTQLSKEEFTTRYNYKGGYIKKDGFEMLPTENIAIITGYNNVEVIDVDLKVFPTLPEQEAFWKELYDYLHTNIDDFDLKFVIYKTKNQGYHILYKCKTIVGNSKIAKLEGHKECVIESRGKGGYVVVYENKISKLDYTEIQEITERDRQILWDICRTYDYVEPQEEIIPTKKPATIYPSNEGITPWQDYNDKTNIFDIIGDDFKIVKKISKHYIILRHGATSTQSGYVYIDSGCMYLFSTGTIYPNEKLITPFQAYTIKYHKGDYTASAKDLYNKGFGSRRVYKKTTEIKETIKVNQDQLLFPIDIFPKEIQEYIIECNQTLDSSIDYMGCSMLWLISVIVGNSMQIEVKKGWYEMANIWVAVVGRAGLGKTPSINNIIYPLQQVNSKKIKDYIRQYEKYQIYHNASEEQKKQHEHVKKPIKQQFIANDITLEALIDLHQESKNAIGVFKDELNGWFKDMNKYRAGSDLEFWLSSWSGKAVSMNRKSATSAFVDKPFIPVLGGIQPSILAMAYTDENKDNGFVDRMLLTYPDLEIEKYNTNEMRQDTIEWYQTFIVSFYDHIKHKMVDYDEDREIKPRTTVLTQSARKEWQRIFNEITEVQNSDEENEYMKSMLPKQKSYIPRFALLINTIDYFMDIDTKDPFTISKESMLKAEKLSKYFIQMAKKVKVNTMEHSELKTITKANTGKSSQEIFNEMYQANQNLNRTAVAELLGVSRRQIIRYIKEMSQ